MAWIKRNLLLVVSGGISLILLGLGGYYLYSAIQKNAQIDQEINSAKSEIQNLLNKPVTPTAENLKLAKQEAVKLNSFVAEAKKMFPASPAPKEPLNPLSFKSLLSRTVTELHQQAEAVGIKIDTNATGPYYFTFEAQRLPVSFEAESLRPLTERLQEVELISGILFKSRINHLVGFKRAMVPGERPTGGGAAPGGGNDYLAAAAHVDTATGMALWPYEVTFECFTPELAAALEGFQNAKYGVIVKTLEIHPADEAATAPGAVRQPGRNINRMIDRAQPPGRQPARQGRPGAPPARGVAPAATPAAGSAPLVTIINEKLLRVTLHIEVIKPDAGGVGGPGGPSGPGGPGGNRRGGGSRPPGGGR